MKIKKAVLLLSFVIQFNLVCGQSSGANAAPGLRLPSDTFQLAPNFYSLPSLSALPSLPYVDHSTLPQALKAPPMPNAYSYEKLGAFCKWEVQLEKAARMPVKFRLGEVQYVERMERKLPDY